MDITTTMKYPNPNNYGIKALKTWATHDGGGYQCKITRKSTRGETVVCEMHNDGNGGCYEFRWVHPQYEAELKAVLATLPHETYDFGDGKSGSFDVNADMYFDDLVSEYETNKKFAAMVTRHKKTYTCFVVAGDEPHTFRTVKSLNLIAVRMMLDKKYGPNQYTVL